MGDTPIATINSEATIGIHTVVYVMRAVFATENTGAATKATTAGRMPQKICSTSLYSRKFWKKRAIISMMTTDGKALPSEAKSAPLTPRSL